MKGRLQQAVVRRRSIAKGNPKSRRRLKEKIFRGRLPRKGERPFNKEATSKAIHGQQVGPDPKRSLEKPRIEKGAAWKKHKKGTEKKQPPGATPENHVCGFKQAQGIGGQKSARDGFYYFWAVMRKVSQEN